VGWYDPVARAPPFTGSDAPLQTRNILGHRSPTGKLREGRSYSGVLGRKSVPEDHSVAKEDANTVADLTSLLVAIARLDREAVTDFLSATPSLAAARLARPDEFFLAERLAQVYEGDTALHAAAFSIDPETARNLMARGAEVRAKNRPGAEPLHAAVIGVPRSASWDPTRQRKSFGS
jgi:ankyrin repeat protein